MLNRVGKIGLGWEVVLVALLFLSRRRSIQQAKPRLGLKYSTCSNPRRNAPIDCCKGVMVFDIERRLEEGGLVELCGFEVVLVSFPSAYSGPFLPSISFHRFVGGHSKYFLPILVDPRLFEWGEFLLSESGLVRPRDKWLSLKVMVLE